MLNEIKRQFFALRNGLLADNLRKQAVDSHRMIFGLNLPQLMQIAAATEKSESLADELWADTGCRESRLLAPMVCPREAVRLRWLSEVTTPEEADILCHRLLRHQPGAAEAAVSLGETDDPLMRYAALRLLLNLMPGVADMAVPLAKKSTENPLTAFIASQILEYA